IELGDNARYVRVTMSREDAACIGLITSKIVDGSSYFIRSALSLCEVDETLRSDLSFSSDKVELPIIRYSIEIGEHL
ncbi:MAG: hypothetical protein AB3N28_00680, partial [Kordiimonas sp.]